MGPSRQRSLHHGRHAGHGGISPPMGKRSPPDCFPGVARLTAPAQTSQRVSATSRWARVLALAAASRSNGEIPCAIPDSPPPWRWPLVSPSPRALPGPPRRGRPRTPPQPAYPIQAQRVPLSPVRSTLSTLWPAPNCMWIPIRTRQSPPKSACPGRPQPGSVARGNRPPAYGPLAGRCARRCTGRWASVRPSLRPGSHLDVRAL